jgi:glycerophosphoryl diester phosphodiesterase
VADGVEVDIRETSDGMLVLCHDPVTPEGIEIAITTFAELSHQGLTRLATYGELLAAARPGKWLFAEVKVPNVVARVVDRGMDAFGDRFRTGSFDPAHLVPAPADRRWLLVEEASAIPADLTPFRGLAARADLYPIATRPGLERAAWDVQPGAQVEALLSQGVRFLIADDPIAVVSQLGGREPR